MPLTTLTESALPPRVVACCAGDEENAGGPALGLQLIDFGRSLDLELLPAGTLLQVGGWSYRGRGVERCRSVAVHVCQCVRMLLLHPPGALIPLMPLIHSTTATMTARPPDCRATAAPTPSAAWRCGRGDPGCGRQMPMVRPLRCTPCCTGGTWKWSGYARMQQVGRWVLGRWFGGCCRDLQRGDYASGIMRQQLGCRLQPCLASHVLHVLTNDTGPACLTSRVLVAPPQAWCRCGCASPSSASGRGSCGAPSSTACSTTRMRRRRPLWMT